MIVHANDIKVSVVTIVGSDQFVRNGFLASMEAQTIADQMELIVLGMGNEIRMPESFAASFEVRIIPLREQHNLLHAQMLGAALGNGKVVAFLEDHCIAKNDWAEAVFYACAKGWPIIGYAFKNGSPDTYYFKSVFLAEYGFFAHPAKSREMDFYLDTNVAYDSEKLNYILGNKSITRRDSAALARTLRNEGYRIYLESRAVVYHRSIGNISELFRIHFAICRVLGHTRMAEGNWGQVRRFLYAMAAVLCVPTLQIWRLFKALGARHPLRKDALLAIPFLFGLKQFAALGEAWGYIQGAGDCEREILDIELNAPRIERD